MADIRQINMGFDGTHLIAVVATTYDPYAQYDEPWVSLGFYPDHFTINDAIGLAQNINTGTSADFALAVIDSDYSDQYIAALAGAANAGDAFIGLSRQPGSDVHSGWTWSDGSSLTYTNWESGEPSNSGSGEYIAEIYARSGTWNDVSSGQSLTGAAYTLNIADILPGTTLIINGTGSDDQLRGTAADDSRLRGYGGNDDMEIINTKGWMAGDDGNDYLIFTSSTAGSQAGSTAYGGNGDDMFRSSGGIYMAGGGGNDTFVMANGDTVKGGSGNDVFFVEITQSDAVYTIANYNNHEQIHLDMAWWLNIPLHFAGHSNLTGSAGEVAFKYVGSKTELMVDFDGDKTADATVWISGHHYIYSNAIDFV